MRRKKIDRALVSFLLPGAFGASPAALASLGFSFRGSSGIFSRLTSCAGGGGEGAPFCWFFVLLSFESCSVACFWGTGSDEEAINKNYFGHDISISQPAHAHSPSAPGSNLNRS